LAEALTILSPIRSPAVGSPVLSHSSADDAFVRELQAALEQAGDGP